MAKRRKLEAPSAEDLSKFEEEFRRETPNRVAPPIAQVAADTAEALEGGTAAERVAKAKTAADAEQYRTATEKGLLVREIPLAEIEPLSMQRDRTMLEKAALE